MKWAKLILVGFIATAFAVKFSHEQSIENAIWTLAALAALGLVAKEAAKSK